MAEITSQMLGDLYNLIRKDGATVWEGNLTEFEDELVSRGVEPSALLSGQKQAGFYLCKQKHLQADIKDYPEYLLCVDNTLSMDEKYLFAIHEWGHHKCVIENCACSTPDFFHPVAETHAHQFVLNYLMAENLPITLFKYVKNLVTLTLRYFGQKEYWDAILTSTLFANLIKAVDPLSALRHTHSADLRQNFGDGAFNSVMEYYDMLCESSIQELHFRAINMPPVQQDSRYAILVNQCFV